MARMVDTESFWARWPDHLRQDAYAWFTLNDIEYHNIPLGPVVEVIVMDGPFIRWPEYVKIDGQIQIVRCGCTHTWNEDETSYDCDCHPKIKVNITPMKFPMPDSLNALSADNAILNWKDPPCQPPTA